MKRNSTMKEKDINDIFDSTPRYLYKYEPFEFYGGNFKASEQDK